MPEQVDLIAELRRANPIPDPEILALPGASQTRHDPERSAPMADTRSRQETRPDRPNQRTFATRPVVVVTVAALVLGLGAVFLIRDRAPVASPLDPIEVGISYFRTLNDADQAGWWALFADDASVPYDVNGVEPRGSLSDKEVREAQQNRFDYITTTGAISSDVNCSDGDVDTTSRGDTVNCTYTYESLISKVMDLTLQGTAQFAVQDGKIISVIHDTVDFSPVENVPNDYLLANHPDEFRSLCDEVPGRGAECAELYLRNLDGIAQAWEEFNGN